MYCIGHDKHSNSRPSNSKDGGNSSSRGDSTTGGRHWTTSTSRDDADISMSKESSRSLQRKQSIESESALQSSTTQDMDISPGDSTPTSETEQQQPQNSVGPVLLANALPRLISHPSNFRLL